MVPSFGYAMMALVCLDLITWRDIRAGNAATSPCCSGSCASPAVRGRSAPVPRATAPPISPGSPLPRNSGSAFGQLPKPRRSKLHSLGSALVPPNSKENTQKHKKFALLCPGAAVRVRGADADVFERLPDDTDLGAWIRSANVYRRHLDKQWKDDYLAALIKKRRGKSAHAIAAKSLDNSKNTKSNHFNALGISAGLGGRETESAR